MGGANRKVQTDDTCVWNSDGKSYSFGIKGHGLVRRLNGKEAGTVTKLIWSTDGKSGSQGVLFDQYGNACVVPREALPSLHNLAEKAGIPHNIPSEPSLVQILSDEDETKRAVVNHNISFETMRGVARELVLLEEKRKRARLGVAFVFAVLVGSVAVILGLTTVIGVTGEYEVRSDDSQLALVKKHSDQLLTTAESVEDRDGADLVDYDRTAEGNDGAWLISSDRIALIRTISWWEQDKMHVQHVSQITRHAGDNPHVDITTKAGHEMVIKDSNDEEAFNVFIRRRNAETGHFDPWEEINANSDSDEMGRGRVVVSLRRPRLEAPTRKIIVDEYF